MVKETPSAIEERKHSLSGRRCPNGGLKVLIEMSVTPYISTCVDAFIKLRYHASPFNHTSNDNKGLIHAEFYQRRRYSSLVL